MKSITRVTGLLAAFLIPAFASAAFSFSFSFGSGSTCGTYIECLGGYIIYIINGILVPVLFAIAFIVFLYGVAEAYIFSRGDPEKVKTGHKFLLWGLIGFAVMISVWGLVNVVTNTLGLGGYSAPPLPTSYSY